ncbi:MAG: hypothetical protein A2021_02285 [Elusimicrobia bacterium GWF2_52_66]|nr:MAG: hypothetical protein A2X33_08310 [Elusimicrobia bacterium GWA2_51_34]OGR85242.1 MAG: hypothetical protein A2021_02285 [Elusimicrobia bacterium GWF2_52_66]HAF95245.1 hypothetical protein [Elusimicrobiota bacterium]HCE97323.1 hypothetical protein [Elusimicrobiota bacterium]
MNTKKIVIGLLAAMALTWAQTAYADNATEFGVEDDLTIMGTAGTVADPDVEIRGFSIFGSTGVTANIPVAPGNIIVNGQMQVSSGAWFVGNSTFTGTVTLPAPVSLRIAGGLDNQVMSYNAANGAMQWADVESMVAGGDSLGSHIATKTLDMAEFGIIRIASASITNGITAGSMTIVNNAGIGGTLGVTGAATLSNTLGVTGVSTLSSDVLMGAKLNVTDASTFGSSITAKGGFHSVVGSTFAGVAFFNDVSSFTAGPSKLYVQGGANGQVLAYNSATGAMQWAANGAGVVGDSLGSHIATQTLDMANFGIVRIASASITNGITAGSMTIVNNAGIGGTLGVTGAATMSDNLTVSSNTLLGANYGNRTAINRALESGVALSVAGDTKTGDYAAKFYSGASLAAWIRKK